MYVPVQLHTGSSLIEVPQAHLIDISPLPWIQIVHIQGEYACIYIYVFLLKHIIYTYY